MGWQLIEELFNSVLLSGAVHIRDLFLRQAGKIQLYLHGSNVKSDQETHITRAPHATFGYCFISSPTYKGRRLCYIRPVTGFVLKIRGPDEPTQQTWLVSDKTSTKLLNCFSGMQFAVTIRGYRKLCTFNVLIIPTPFRAGQQPSWNSKFPSTIYHTRHDAFQKTGAV